MKKKANEDFELENYLRGLINGEYEAIASYEQFEQFTKNKQVKSTLQDIANEERTHVGELEALYADLFPNKQKYVDDGIKEFNENKIAKELMKIAAYMDFEVFYDNRDHTICCELELEICSYPMLQSKIEEFKKLVNKEIDKARKANLQEDFFLSCDEKRIWIAGGCVQYSIMGLKKDLSISDFKSFGYKVKG